MDSSSSFDCTVSSFAASMTGLIVVVPRSSSFVVDTSFSSNTLSFSLTVSDVAGCLLSDSDVLALSVDDLGRDVVSLLIFFISGDRGLSLTAAASRDAKSPDRSGGFLVSYGLVDGEEDKGGVVDDDDDVCFFFLGRCTVVTMPLIGSTYVSVSVS